nr:zinc finger, CCHC-type [Tanacetum cinerariifolium]
MMLELKTMFAQQTEQELLQTTRGFHSCKQEEWQSVSSYVLKIKGYIDNLEHLRHPVTLGLGVSLIIIDLRKEFDDFVQNYNMHSMGKTINELHAMLKLHEQTLPKNNAPVLHVIRAGKVQKVTKHKKSQSQMAAKGQNHGKGKNKLAYAPKPKIPPPPKREDPTKDSICHECGGIFEIDLSNSYTNESSINVVSNKRAKLDLDSAFLWHCRLRHISKKRIEKLQHDGLLNSTDLRAFEKCVSCMSGKMERKRYTHQVERAKDLLGLIHTDEVEKQLGKTIKSLHYDRGGEYMSQEFLDHLKDHEIIAHRTPPYPPQHNGVLERRNRTLLDMVRSMMSQTTLPKSFWDYALETATRILNIVPTKKVEKTPYENVTSRFQQNLGDLHWSTVKNILKYLKNTKDMFLVYEDAKYITTFDAFKEARWVRKLISRLGVVPTIEEPISMYCDNTGATAIANESGITKGARLFRAKVHYLCEVIEYGDVK